MRREPVVAILILFSLLLSCSTKYPKSPTSKTSKAEEEKILFIAYEITRDSISGKIAAKILYQRTAVGSI